MISHSYIYILDYIGLREGSFVKRPGNWWWLWNSSVICAGPIEGRRQRFQVAEDLFLSSLPTSCQTVLWDPHELIAGGSMTDEFALRHAPDGWHGRDGSYICLESGQASDRSSVDAIYLAVLQCLRKLQMLGPLGFEGRLGPGDKKPRTWRHFEIMEKFSLDHRGFEWTNGHGEYNFQVVPAGHVYGRKGQVELRAPEGKEPLAFNLVRFLVAISKFHYLSFKIRC